MGWDTDQVGRSTLWRFQAAVRGWRRFHGLDGADKARPPTAAEFEAAVASITP